MPAIDAGLILSAQAVEHYEITRYGTLKRWAKGLGLTDAVKVLDQTLEEESNTDEALTELADASANEIAKAADLSQPSAIARWLVLSATIVRKETIMGRGILLWLLGVPIPIIILLVLLM